MKRLALAVLTLLAASACGSGSSSTSSEPSIAPLLRPTNLQRERLLNELAQIDQRLVVNEDRTVRHAVNLCQKIKATNGPGLTVAGYAASEFSGDSITLTGKQAVYVIEAIQDSFCR